MDDLYNMFEITPTLKPGALDMYIAGISYILLILGQKWLLEVSSCQILMVASLMYFC